MYDPVPLDLKLSLEIKNPEKIFDLIRVLKQVEGALNYDGDASIQVLLPLKGGGCIRIGSTDNDLTDTPDSVWVDRYDGLAFNGGNIQD